MFVCGCISLDKLHFTCQQVMENYAVLQRCKVGEQRRLEREAAERREANIRLQAVVKRQKLEMSSISVIQRVFRGHLGRKATKRWALKRAELAAMNALMNATL